jgi:hypothetical protein
MHAMITKEVSFIVHGLYEEELFCTLASSPQEVSTAHYLDNLPVFV